MTPRLRPAGRSSASSSPTTSPPIARRSSTGPIPTRCATTAPRGRTSSPSTEAGRSARRTSTSATTRPGCCSARPASTCAQRRGRGAGRRPAQRHSHLFMNQLQVAFLRAHNLLVDRLRADGEPEQSVFDEARFSLTWHYQWVLLHDFLPSLIGAELAARLLDRGGELYRVDGEPLSRSSSPTPIPLRPLADPPPLPDQRSTVRPAAVPDLIGFAPWPGDGGQLVVALRRPRSPGGAAGETDRRTPARIADQPAAGDLKRGRRRRLPVARRARPAARAGHRCPRARRSLASSASRRCRPPSAGSASMAGRARRRSGSTS